VSDRNIPSNLVSDDTLRAWLNGAEENIESGVATDMVAVCPLALRRACRELIERRSRVETTANRSVTLNGYQLRNALEFCAPDNDADQLESEVSIQWGDAGHSGAGYYACCAEYPEEGSILLDDKPAESSEKTSVPPEDPHDGLIVELNP
jgi:hypothetical protein